MYLQWIAAEQWKAARRAGAPVRVFGDLPFMISANSADVWLRQGEFRLDATIGAPPDAFAKDGQDWGLPPWRWRVMKERDYGVVPGARPPPRRAVRGLPDRSPRRPLPHLDAAHGQDPARRISSPAEEADQRALGEDLRRHLQGRGRRGDCRGSGIGAGVRAGLDHQRWAYRASRCCNGNGTGTSPGSRPSIPRTFTALSVATTGTHDIEPLAATSHRAGGAGDRRQRCWTPARTSRSFRCRTSSAGPIASIRRAW